VAKAVELVKDPITESTKLPSEASINGLNTTIAGTTVQSLISPVLSAFLSATTGTPAPTAAAETEAATNAPTAAAVGKSYGALLTDNLTLGVTSNASMKNKLCTGQDGNYSCTILDEDGKVRQPQKCVVDGDKLKCTYNIGYINNTPGVNCKSDGDSLVCMFDINAST
jgi:hypothetical protein